MFVLASSLRDVVSPTMLLVVILALIIPAAFVGFFVRSPSRGFMLGGLTCGTLTFLWLGVASNNAMAFAAIFTPNFAIIGGLVGCFFGGIGRLVRGDPQQLRQRVAEQTPFELRLDSERETPLNPQQGANEQLSGPDSERDAV